MSKEGQEDFLDDLLRSMHGNSKRERITKKRVAKLVKEVHDFALDFRGLCRKRGISGVWETRRVDRIRGRHRLGFLECIFHFPRFCSRFFNHVSLGTRLIASEKTPNKTTGNGIFKLRVERVPLPHPELAIPNG